MSKKRFGIVIVSHVKELAAGLEALLAEVAKEVEITYAGGIEEGAIGTSFEAIHTAIVENDADKIFAFYDLGSAKINLEMAIEMTDKTIYLIDAAVVEGAYTTAALIQADASFETIMDQLKPLCIK
ncbi:PTS-dependent dihydroxyacetone kinase phosphotransferase subunit DhaM [Bacillus ginsengihumi]|uniref:phosphoenolpyruvate--glycerone phosphotransferase n=1 Tax=Heyndrickxia ginsengihumi TaxID=363870 RepID=A0A0A6V944_9BACI|nr:dihydroxyacetone kinase phosphoryl donor subunit DhaM [Heyndrickxia ginsengihumi]KHD84111.1 PTS system mannnose-specific family transporter subunit IIA [Heyndrickxia ginsengihumi]MBE6184081.1 PTS-dependent dihydroxyacetone kinase phosphotransferase subunit DhaM [Bacillus sp. (in: firmicutes)]MCM3023031.1 dihydroxyacetone kinase phosphoryl donor subunit DhaM [Heyndrickxia ginsengihumi]NEY19501.1 PTS-dependent dihydroxyacetone kinase phosphotransferase subunit DhaM [Heyndrickxia ginsengihumi]